MEASKPPLLVLARPTVEPVSVLRSCEKRLHIPDQFLLLVRPFLLLLLTPIKMLFHSYPHEPPQETVREKFSFLRLLMVGVSSWPLSFINKASLATTAIPSWIHCRTSAEASFLCLAHVIASLSRSCYSCYSLPVRRPLAVLPPSGPSWDPLWDSDCLSLSGEDPASVAFKAGRESPSQGTNSRVVYTRDSRALRWFRSWAPAETAVSWGS
jgi:hypothetical protein